MYIPQAGINGLLVRHRRNYGAQAVLVKYCLKELKMYGRHLRCQHRMRLFAFLRKVRPLDFRNFPIREGLFAGQRCHQRAQADSGRAEIGHFVQLNHGVNTLVTFQNVLDLLGGQGVQTAAEGAELNQGEILMFGHKLRGMIQPGMIAPLIDHFEFP